MDPHLITHRALDSFIRTVFPHWDGIMSDQNWYAGNTYSLTVKGENSTRQEWVDFIERKDNPYGRISGRGVLPMLLNFLASKGHIPDGEYEIEVEF